MEILRDETDFPGFIRAFQIFDVVVAVDVDEGELHVGAVVVLFPEQLVKLTSSVAEVAVDEVIYVLRGGEILHVEVEIEAKSDLGRLLMGTIAAELAQHKEIRCWHHSKIETGTALAELVDSNEFRKRVREGILRKEALDHIDQHFGGEVDIAEKDGVRANTA